MVCVQKDDGDLSPSAEENGTTKNNDAPITVQPEASSKPAGNPPIVLGPPPPAPAPRPATTVSAADGTSPTEKAPLYSGDEKPQLYDGYGY